MKIEILFFSTCGSTKNMAQALQSMLQKDNSVTITDATCLKHFSAQGDILVVCAPVYERSLPHTFMELLNNSQLDFAKVALILTYGKVTVGNAVYDVRNVFTKKNLPLVCAVAIPTKHCFIVSKSTTAPIKQIKKFATIIIEKKRTPKAIEKIKKCKNYFEIYIKKNYSKFFPTPKKNIEKCISCGLCVDYCPSPNKCIRCLACLRKCPQKAIIFNIHIFPKIGLSLSTILWHRIKFWK